MRRVDMKGELWHIFKTTLISRQLTKFDLDFKSTLKSTLISKRQFFAHFQINFDFKATWIFHRWIINIHDVSLVTSEEGLNNNSLERFWWNDSLVALSR